MLAQFHQGKDTVNTKFVDCFEQRGKGDLDRQKFRVFQIPLNDSRDNP